MAKVTLYVLFFTKRPRKDADRWCKRLARSKKIEKAKLISIEPDLSSEHIHCYVAMHPGDVQNARAILEETAKRITSITGFSDLIVQVMGHPELEYRPKPRLARVA